TPPVTTGTLISTPPATTGTLTSTPPSTMLGEPCPDGGRPTSRGCPPVGALCYAATSRSRRRGTEGHEVRPDSAGLRKRSRPGGRRGSPAHGFAVKLPHADARDRARDR